MEFENAIEINNLTKKYDGFTLDNISFTVPKGSIMGFIGQNGAGMEILSTELKDSFAKMSLIGYIGMALYYIFIALFSYISYRISCAVYKKGILRDDI